MIMKTSFLTIGGWDQEDYKGNITWFPTDEMVDVRGWDQKLT